MPAVRVLVIDDHDLLRAALVRWLSPHAIVEAVATYDEALQRIAGGEEYDRILCDLQTPGASCDAFYERLTQLSPRAARRLIFASGGAPATLLEFVRRTGRAFIAKPFDVNDLIAQILDARAA